MGTRGGRPVASTVLGEKVVSQAIVTGPEARVGEHSSEALCLAPTPCSAQALIALLWAHQTP